MGGGSPSQQSVYIFTMPGGSLPSPPSSDHGTFHHLWFLFCSVCLLLLFSMAGDPSLRPFPQTTAPFISCFFFFLHGRWTQPLAPSLRRLHFSSAVVLLFFPSPLPADHGTFHQLLCFFPSPLSSDHGTFHQLLHFSHGRWTPPLSPSLRPRHGRSAGAPRRRTWPSRSTASTPSPREAWYVS